MKKLICVFVAIAIISLLTGCGNMSLGFGNFNFNGIHCSDFAGNVCDFSVVKWYDSGNGIEVKTKEAGSLFFSEGTYILYEEACPICKDGG